MSDGGLKDLLKAHFTHDLFIRNYNIKIINYK